MSLSELRSLITTHASDQRLSIDGVAVSLVEQPGPPTTGTSSTVFALIAQGAKRIGYGDRAYEYGPGEYLVASVDLPITGHFSRASPEAPALGFGLTLQPSKIAALLLEAGPGAVLRGAAAPPGLAVSRASEELIDAVVRLLRLLDHPRDAPVLAPMIEREILWRLIHSEQGATVRELGLAGSSLSFVGRAVTWIRDHHAEPLRVEDLAKMSGMSVSAFHRNFRAVTAMSPIQFQKQIRLQSARTLLLTRPDDVAGAGRAVGYESASQFSREYRRLFGRPPGQDAVRLRVTA